MLNQRQLEILLELCENPGQYLPASFFAEKQQVSLRTAQNDMRRIRQELTGYDCVEFQSTATKGSRVAVRDESAFDALKDQFYQRLGNATMSYQGERIQQLLLLLLRQRRPASYYDLESTVFVSRNTLTGDLKRVEEILQKYRLELLHNANRVMVEGSEIDKRLCITEENLFLSDAASHGQTEPDPMSRIKDILVETFVSFRHNVSEVDLNNMILLLHVAIRRMEEWFFIAPFEMETPGDLEPERKIAASVFKQLGDVFHIRVPETEIDFFALYIRGRGSASSTSVISQEVDDLVLDGLREIRRASQIDLTNDVNLRIALALHCTQLIVRIQYDMQMKSHIVDYIRQTFPQGYDIATYFASFLQKRFQKRVRDEEIAFIAIHMYKGLSDLQRGAGTKKVLVISSLRRSENILVRQTLYKWFGDQIAELFFIPPTEMNEFYLDKYDTFLTTEKGKYYDLGLAFYINPFPGQQDYLNLKLVMDGFESINDILQIFHRDLFETLRKETDRDGILNLMCSKSARFYGLEGLREAVQAREELGSSYFGNGIAAPHPMFAVSSDTFIAVCVSPWPVAWDGDGNRVNLAMLVSVGKNNPKAFQIWNYLSKTFADRTFAARLLQEPSYENFLRLLKDVIADDFKA